MSPSKSTVTDPAVSPFCSFDGSTSSNLNNSSRFCWSPLLYRAARPQRTLVSILSLSSSLTVTRPPLILSWFGYRNLFRSFQRPRQEAGEHTTSADSSPSRSRARPSKLPRNQPAKNLRKVGVHQVALACSRTDVVHGFEHACRPTSCASPGRDVER